MSLANMHSRPTWLHAVPKPPQSPAPKERTSDVWPDLSTELSECELAKSAEKNRPSTIFGEAVGAVIYSVGLVVLLMAVLGAFHLR
jgi:hypothetical protein